MLDQILADPADDALRLVYADQLLAAGDERGEYITVEVQLAAAAPGSPARGALARRRAELRGAHGAAWWPELPERRIGTRCGFAETVAVFGSELGMLPRLASREPIAALELLDYEGQALAGAPWQDRIRRLAVHGRLSARRLGALLDSPLCDVVEDLAIASDDAYRWPPLADRLPRCRRLSLAGSQLDDVARLELLQLEWTDPYGSQPPPPPPLAALAGWEHVADLEVLDLSHCWGLSVEGVDALAALDLRALRVLRLSGSRIGDDGAVALAAGLRVFPALERLELVDAQLGERGVAALRSAGARAEIVLQAPRPTRIAIDAVGVDLELFQVNESEWAAAIDGARRPIQTRSRGELRQLIYSVSDRALLGPVVRALSWGARRHLLPDGIAVTVGDRQAVLAIAPDRSELRYEPGG